MTCYICRSPMKFKIIEIDNYWDNKSKKEKTEAYVCEECGETVLSPEETERLQELAKKY